MNISFFEKRPKPPSTYGTGYKTDLFVIFIGGLSYIKYPNSLLGACLDISPSFRSITETRNCTFTVYCVVYARFLESEKSKNQTQLLLAALILPVSFTSCTNSNPGKKSFCGARHKTAFSSQSPYFEVSNSRSSVTGDEFQMTILTELLNPI